MENFQLTTNQRNELIVALKFARKTRAKDAYKINAILLLGSSWTLEAVAEALFLSDETISKYKRDYIDGELSKLLDKRYRGSDCKLTENEQRILCDELDGNIYLTTAQAVSFVEKTFGITYSISGMNDLLHRLDYSYKKPKLVPGKSDGELQEAFIEQYEEFMATKPDNTAVYFMDGVHPQHNTMAAYGWIKKGEERKLKTNAGRQRINLHGAINIETLEVEVVEGERVNSESTVELLKQIEKSCPLAIAVYIILDNARYHYSKVVKEYLKESRIRLVFLPSYSPNLNLIERLWRLFKKKIVYNRYYEKFKDFKGACLGFFENIHAYGNEIQSLMTEEFQLI